MQRSRVLVAVLTAFGLVLPAGVAVAAPTNDDVADAEVIDVATDANHTETRSSTAGSTLEDGEDTRDGQILGSVWFELVGLTEGRTTGLVMGGSHTTLELYERPIVGAPVPVAVDGRGRIDSFSYSGDPDEEWRFVGEWLRFTPEAGVRYLVQVGTTDLDDGSFSIFTNLAIEVTVTGTVVRQGAGTPVSGACIEQHTHVDPESWTDYDPRDVMVASPSNVRTDVDGTYSTTTVLLPLRTSGWYAPEFVSYVWVTDCDVEPVRFRSGWSWHSIPLGEVPPSGEVTFDGDVEVSPVGAVAGSVVVPESLVEGCGQVRLFPPSFDRTADAADAELGDRDPILLEEATKGPDGAWVRSFTYPEVDTGEWLVSVGACKGWSREDQRVLDAEWPALAVYSGDTTAVTRAVPVSVSEGVVSEVALAVPPVGQERRALLSYVPGPDGDGMGRLWGTDTTLRTTRLVARFGTPSGWQTHLAGDLDGDGETSLYSYFPGPDGDGRGRWWSTELASGGQRLVTRFGTPSGWATHLVADLDGDGRDELLSYHGATGRWWSTTVVDGRASQRLLTTFGTRSGWQTHAVGDVDADGRDELVSYHEATGRWWVTDDDGDTVSQRRVATYSTRSGWDTHLVGDVTGDGVPELVSFHPATGRWWSTDVSGAEPDLTILTTYGDGDGLEGITWGQHLLGDVDRDGRDDLLSYDAVKGRWWWLPSGYWLSFTSRHGPSGAFVPHELTRYGTPDGWQTHLVASTG